MRLTGRCRSAGRTHVTLRNTSALLRPETQFIGLKSFNQCHFSGPLTLQQRETCMVTLPIGTPAECRHTYTIHALVAENYQEHAHARVCSALTYSVLQCPGVMPGFTDGDGDWALPPVPPGMKYFLAPLWKWNRDIIMNHTSEITKLKPERNYNGNAKKNSNSNSK